MVYYHSKLDIVQLEFGLGHMINWLGDYPLFNIRFVTKCRLVDKKVSCDNAGA